MGKKTYKEAWSDMSATAKKKYETFDVFEKAAIKWNKDNKKISTYDKSNKQIQDNMSKGAEERRRGNMLDNDPSLKKKFKKPSSKKRLFQEEVPITVKPKKVKKIPNPTKTPIPKRYQLGGFIEPGIENID